MLERARSLVGLFVVVVVAVAVSIPTLWSSACHESCPEPV